MSFIEDFASIRADLARLEEAKKPKTVEVTEGKVSDWAEYGGMYGWPNKTSEDLTG